MNTQPSPNILKRRREELHKTPEQIAGSLLISVRTYQRAENDPGSVKVTTLLRICEELELDIQEVLKDARREKG